LWKASKNQHLPELLNVAAPSATKMVQKIIKLGLLNYKKYGIISLTENGIISLTDYGP
jgi:Mn-dependent DtxR family transcriptional regulator